MKKIDSIHFGGKFVAAIFIFIVVIPACLGIIGIFIQAPIIHKLIWGSIGVGLIILSIFLIILFAEHIQDKKR